MEMLNLLMMIVGLVMPVLLDDIYLAFAVLCPPRLIMCIVLLIDAHLFSYDDCLVHLSLLDCLWLAMPSANLFWWYLLVIVDAVQLASMPILLDDTYLFVDAAHFCLMTPMMPDDAYLYEYAYPLLIHTCKGGR
jgi:hypothetical protein